MFRRGMAQNKKLELEGNFCKRGQGVVGVLVRARGKLWRIRRGRFGFCGRSAPFGEEASEVPEGREADELPE